MVIRARRWGRPATPHQVQRRPHADVVVTQSAAVRELPAPVDDALLDGRKALLVLDLLLHGVDRVARLDVERDGLAREGLDEDLRWSEGECRVGGRRSLFLSEWAAALRGVRRALDPRRSATRLA